jgi:deoxyadenosine/deoxycytidine kinase
MFIHIEGNIGAGKSTFLKFLQDNLPCVVSYEPVKDWQELKDNNDTSILEKFYSDFKRWSFTFQMNCFLTRLRNIENLNNEDINFVERSILSDRYCFAKNCFKEKHMNEIEYEVYCRMHTWYYENMKTKIDAIIYLRTDPEISQKRIIKRSRKGEENIPLEYLKDLHESHEDWLKETDIPVIVLDANESLYNNEILEMLRNKFFSKN